MGNSSIDAELRYYFQVEDWTNGFNNWWSNKRANEWSATHQLMRAATSPVTLLFALQHFVGTRYLHWSPTMATTIAVLTAAASYFTAHASTALLSIAKALTAVGVGAESSLVLRLVATAEAASKSGKASSSSSSSSSSSRSKPWDDGVVWQRARVLYEDKNCYRRFSMIWAKGGAGTQCFVVVTAHNTLDRRSRVHR